MTGGVGVGVVKKQINTCSFTIISCQLSADLEPSFINFHVKFSAFNFHFCTDLYFEYVCQKSITAAGKAALVFCTFSLIS